jgi:hypothetical protein
MHNLKRLTRDDTEHGNDYYLAAEVDKMLTAQQSAPVKSLECAHCHITIEALNQKAMQLIDENQRLRAELKFNTPPVAPVQEVKEWMKPHPKCDWSCMYLCTHGFSRFPECAAPEKGGAA